MAAAIGDLSMQVKLGWAVWLAWGVVVLGWYRHARIAAPTETPPGGALHAARFSDPQSVGNLAPDSMPSDAPTFTEGFPAYTELNEYPDIEQR
jgi:hypothetical protein